MTRSIIVAPRADAIRSELQQSYGRAFQCYALAAAPDGSCEALYKLGDMYARGEAMPQNKKIAYELWNRSYQASTDIEEGCQPAFHMAEAQMDPDAQDVYGCSFNPFTALTLYSQAEVGLRIAISNGMFYYKERLQQAIEGQAVARALLDQR